MAAEARAASAASEQARAAAAHATYVQSEVRDLAARATDLDDGKALVHGRSRLEELLARAADATDARVVNDIFKALEQNNRHLALSLQATERENENLRRLVGGAESPRAGPEAQVQAYRTRFGVQAPSSDSPRGTYSELHQRSKLFSSSGITASTAPSPRRASAPELIELPPINNRRAVPAASPRKHAAAKAAARSPMSQVALQNLFTRIALSSPKLFEMLESMGAEEESFTVERGDFILLIRTLGLGRKYDDEDIGQIFDYIDRHHLGTLTHYELRVALQPETVVQADHAVRTRVSIRRWPRSRGSHE